MGRNSSNNRYHRPAWVEVNLKQLAQNVRVIKKAIGPCSQLMAVVKADAYGHGAIPVAKMTLKAGAKLLGVALLEEGVALREAGVRAPIVVLYPEAAERAPYYVPYGLMPTICDASFGQHYAQALKKRGRRSEFYIKVETGMHRYGLPVNQNLALLQRLKNFPALRLAGAFSHFADSGEDGDYSQVQLARFRSALSAFAQAGFPPPLASIANSGALLEVSHSALDMARIGILLFGVPPVPHHKVNLPVKPILSIKSRIAFLKEVPSGTPISYGRTFTTERPTLVATLPLGFADGFPRQLSNRGAVLVRGKKAPVIGRVCMDAFMVDVTGIVGVKVGDEVVLVGWQGKEAIDLWALASAIDTTAYEVVSRLGKRLPVDYRL